jgi:hypothetical protein
MAKALRPGATQIHRDNFTLDETGEGSVALIFRGHVDVVDDDGIYGKLFGLKLEAELIPDGGVDGDAVGSALFLGPIRTPFERENEATDAGAPVSRVTASRRGR